MRQRERKRKKEGERAREITNIQRKEPFFEGLQFLGILNEALVKMALNVCEHRQTPVLHSAVRSIPLQVSTSN